MLEISKEVLNDPLALFRQFEIIEDPRINRHKQYPLINILVFAFVAILSDQQSWYQIFAFAQANLNWFAEFIDISSGVPSHDTFRRVFSILNPKYLEDAVIKWTEEMRLKKKMEKRRVVILDGKALRGVPWKVNDKQLYLLNAWEAEENQFLGQLTIEEKTNEIKAAPQLLEKLNLENTIVSVDAIMTQKEVAEKIIDGGGNYVMALKGNQGTLFEDVRLYFSEINEGMSSWRTLEKNRGRVECRTCTLSFDIEWLAQKEEWKGLKGILRIDSETIYEGKSTQETRYFITSLEEMDASSGLYFVRKHWSIENGLHRTLDINFNEDSCQVHDRNAASNLSILRKIAISLLKAIDPKKRLIWKMKEAAYSAAFRTRCLLGEF
jgi:predicted transposase YbfD/YdcC